MLLNVYKDEQCQQPIGGATLGAYTRIEGQTTIISTYSAVKQIEEESVQMWQLYSYVLSSVSSDPSSMLTDIPATDTEEMLYLYFSTACRFQYSLYKVSQNNYTMKLYGFEYLISGTWTALTQTPIGGLTIANIYELNGLTFREADSAGYWSSGTFVPIAPIDGGFLGIDVTYKAVGSSSSTTLRAAAAMSPSRLILEIPSDMKYKPTKNSRRGGTGTGVYPNNPVPALPTNGINAAFASVLGDGYGLTYYDLSSGAFAMITQKVYGNALSKIGDAFQEHFLTNMLGSMSKDRESICSAVLIPATPKTEHATNGTVFLATRFVEVGSGNAPIIKEPLVELDMGTIYLEGFGFQSWADIISTAATLLLPGYGSVNIQMDAIANGQLHVQAVIDTRNGNILYRVLTKSETDQYETIYGQYTGNVGIPIPIGGSSAADNILGAIGGAAGSLAVGNAAGFMGSVAAAASSFVPTIDKAGIMQPQAACTGTSEIRLQIYRANVLTPERFKEIAGIPSAGGENHEYKVSQFKSASGLAKLVCSDADVSGISGATRAEKEEILSLLKEGVYV